LAGLDPFGSFCIKAKRTKNKVKSKNLCNHHNYKYKWKQKVPGRTGRRNKQNQYIPCLSGLINNAAGMMPERFKVSYQHFFIKNALKACIFIESILFFACN
jgi:hypothetical protein